MKAARDKFFVQVGFSVLRWLGQLLSAEELVAYLILRSHVWRGESESLEPFLARGFLCCRLRQRKVASEAGFSYRHFRRLLDSLRVRNLVKARSDPAKPFGELVYILGRKRKAQTSDDPGAEHYLADAWLRRNLDELENAGKLKGSKLLHPRPIPPVPPCPDRTEPSSNLTSPSVLTGQGPRPEGTPVSRDQREPSSREQEGKEKGKNDCTPEPSAPGGATREVEHGSASGTDFEEELARYDCYGFRKPDRKKRRPALIRKSYLLGGDAKRFFDRYCRRWEELGYPSRPPSPDGKEANLLKMMFHDTCLVGEKGFDLASEMLDIFLMDWPAIRSRRKFDAEIPEIGLFFFCREELKYSAITGYGYTLSGCGQSTWAKKNQADVVGRQRELAIRSGWSVVHPTDFCATSAPQAAELSVAEEQLRSAGIPQEFWSATLRQIEDQVPFKNWMSALIERSRDSLGNGLGFAFFGASKAMTGCCASLLAKSVLADNGSVLWTRADQIAPATTHGWRHPTQQHRKQVDVWREARLWIIEGLGEPLDSDQTVATVEREIRQRHHDQLPIVFTTDDLRLSRLPEQILRVLRESTLAVQVTDVRVCPLNPPASPPTVGQMVDRDA